MNLGTWLADNVITEQNKNIKTVIAVYPGRFQPMGKHHVDTFKWIEKQFGPKNTFVVTSDTTNNTNSPFNFKEKQAIINKHNIKNVVQVRNPYRADELLKKYDPNTTAAVFIVGKKDAQRLGGKFFRPWTGSADIGYDKGAYTLVAPHISLRVPGQGEMSGTTIRQALAAGGPHLFKQIMGWFDPTIYKTIVKKLSKKNEVVENSLSKEWWDNIFEDITIPINIGDTVLMGRFKNKKIVVKTISWNEKGDLLINGRSASRFRLIPQSEPVNEKYEDYGWRLEINPTRGGISPDALRKKLTDAGIDFEEVRKNQWQILAPKDGSGSAEAMRLLDMNHFNNYKVYESVNEAVKYKKGDKIRIKPSALKSYQDSIESSDSNWCIPVYTFIRYTKKSDETKFPNIVAIRNGKYEDLPIGDVIPFKGSIKIESVNEGLLLEGGAAGHMNHPFDDRDLTFKDLKKLILLSLDGKLNLEKDVTEKTDGQALAVTFKDGKVGAARNKSEILNPLDVKQVKMKFGGRGNITDAFSYAMEDLEKAILSLPEDERMELFQNGKRFVNLEIIYPATKNVIAYGPGAYLQFHGLTEYDEKGKKTTDYPEYGEILQKLIAGVNADVQKYFKIIPPKILTMNRLPDFEKKETYYLNKINQLQKEFKLKDSDEIMKYHQRWWENFINEKFPTASEEVKAGLLQRWAYNDKGFRLNGKSIPDPEVLKSAIEFDKMDFVKQNKKNIYQFEKIFLELGVDVLHNISDYLAVNPKESVQDLRKNIALEIKKIQASGKLEDLEKLEHQLKRIEDMGGFEKIVPAEGIVFVYKGKTYKLTGLFAPVNQLLGLMKFTR